MGHPAGRIKDMALFIAIVAAVFQTFVGIVEAVSYALLREDKEGVSHEQLGRIFE